MKRTLSVKDKTACRNKKSLKTAYRSGFSRGLAHSLILLAALIVLTGGLLYGEESDDALYIDQNGNVGIGTDKPTSRLHVKGEVLINGNIKASGVEVSGRIKDKTGYLVPAGGIIMYTGSIADFDSTGKGKTGTKVQGWALCNGQNSTPDLRDRFVVGAGKAYEVNKIGGENSHKLTPEEMPQHRHQYARAKWNTMQWKGGARDPFWTDNGRDRYQTVLSGPAGKSLPHENRPPYHAVFFIMKLMGSNR
jgi:hypothetical protein